MEVQDIGILKDAGEDARSLQTEAPDSAADFGLGISNLATSETDLALC